MRESFFERYFQLVCGLNQAIDNGIIHKITIIQKCNYYSFILPNTNLRKMSRTANIGMPTVSKSFVQCHTISLSFDFLTGIIRRYGNVNSL